LFAVAARVSVDDDAGEPLYYVQQKAFRLREEITVYRDVTQSIALYRVRADRVLDISARYAIVDATDTPVGAVQRRGLRSLWRAHYEIELEGALAFVVSEENPWVRLLDNVVGTIPVLDLLGGYFLNPSYRLQRAGSDDAILRLRKQRALFEGRFSIDKVGPLPAEEERVAVLGLLIVVLLERSRG
jgi:hypothetical protein